MTGRRALLIDFDGVLRLWPTSYDRMEEKHGLPAGALKKAAFSRELLHPAITGSISDQLWRSQIVEALLKKYPNSRSTEAVAEWSQLKGTLDQQVLDIIRQCSQIFPVILVTNGTSRLSEDLHALNIQDAFHAIANSSQLGFAKPAPEIYQAALAMANAAASDALFVDDSQTHVNSAIELGICAHRFESASGLLSFLEKEQIL